MWRASGCLFVGFIKASTSYFPGISNLPSPKADTLIMGELELVTTESKWSFINPVGLFGVLVHFLIY